MTLQDALVTLGFRSLSEVSEESLKKQRRVKIKIYHSDVSNDPFGGANVNMAYDVLANWLKNGKGSVVGGYRPGGGGYSSENSFGSGGYTPGSGGGASKRVNIADFAQYYIDISSKNGIKYSEGLWNLQYRGEVEYNGGRYEFRGIMARRSDDSYRVSIHFKYNIGDQMVLTLVGKRVPVVLKANTCFVNMDYDGYMKVSVAILRDLD